MSSDHICNAGSSEFIKQIITGWQKFQKIFALFYWV